MDGGRRRDVARGRTVNCRASLDDAQAAFEASAAASLDGFTEIYSQTADDPTVAPPDRHVISVFCQYAPAEKPSRTGMAACARTRPTRSSG